MRQGIRSTKPNPQIINCKPTEATSLSSNTTPSHVIHIKVKYIIKLYTDGIVRFPVRSRSGNQYIIISYHCDSNAIIVAPFKSHADKNRLIAYGAIIKRIKDRNILADLQILDNEASTE